jgi:hypothetical protein
MDVSQFYQFRSSLGTSVIVRRGADAPVVTGGGARWKTVPRPRRTSIVQWDGNDPYTMDVSVLFDGWSTFDDMESDIALLMQMRMADNVADLTPPPTVYVDGGVPVKGARWVIADITWGTNVIYHANDDKAFRYRQDAVVHLLQYIEESVLTFKKPSNSSVLHIVKDGETLRGIAKKHTGDPKNSKAIQNANNIRDPKTIRPGDTLKIPKSSRQSLAKKSDTTNKTNVEKALSKPFLRPPLR